MTFRVVSAAAHVLFVVVAASELVVHGVWGHGRLMEPPNRASLFRFPEFAHLDPPHNYEDNELFCGNFETQYFFNGGKCGVCGDPFNETMPRTHEDGGENYRGIIVRGYRSGQAFPVEVQLTASHLGYFEFRLCAKDDTSAHLSQKCYEEHILKIANYNNEATPETKYKVPVQGEAFYAKYHLVLPKGVTCQHCVLQWHYQTGNRWGNCTDGTQAMGCGDQEVFRGCSDIIIYPEDTDERKINRNPNSRYGAFRPHHAENSTEETATNVFTGATTKVPPADNFTWSFHNWENGYSHIHPIHG